MNIFLKLSISDPLADRINKILKESLKATQLPDDGNVVNVDVDKIISELGMPIEMIAPWIMNIKGMKVRPATENEIQQAYVITNATGDKVIHHNNDLGYVLSSERVGACMFGYAAARDVVKTAKGYDLKIIPFNDWK